MGEAWRLIGQSLSGRLLLLTLLYVMITQVLIFLPSVGRYYRSLLDEHIETAQIAILPFTEPGGSQLSAGLRRELLMRAGATAVILKRADQSELYLKDECLGISTPSSICATAICCAKSIGRWARIFDGGDRVLRIVSFTRIPGAQDVEVILDEMQIHARLLDYARNVFYVAVLISLAIALLVFLSLYFVFVRPMGMLTRAMVVFRDNPEDPGRIVAPSNRRDEIGLAERELAAMQRDLYGFLQQKGQAGRAWLGGGENPARSPQHSRQRAAGIGSAFDHRRSRGAAADAASRGVARSRRGAGDEHIALRSCRRASARAPAARGRAAGVRSGGSRHFRKIAGARRYLDERRARTIWKSMPTPNSFTASS